MATIEETRGKTKMAEEEYKKAVEELKKFKEGENDGKWLEELRGKVRRKEQLDEDDKRQLVRLEEKEKSLEAEKKRWGDQVEEWGKVLRGFGGGEGNEQIAKKIIFRSFHFVYFSFIQFRLFIYSFALSTTY